MRLNSINLVVSIIKRFEIKISTEDLIDLFRDLINLFKDINIISLLDKKKLNSLFRSTFN